jgi:hypothetical protein
MIAIAFTFSVNSSFLDYSHPITIPIDYYGKMRKAKLDEETYSIVYPKGETLKAKMYFGRPGQAGEYYRLTVTKRYQKLPEYLQFGDRLIVILTRYYKHNYAILEYIRKSKTRLWK